MSSRNDRRLGFVAGAARGAAAIPARAAANVARDRLEEVADAMLASPGTLRAVDRVLAGPLPEEIVRSAVRNRVLERMVSEMAASGALDELVSGALGSRQTQALVDRIVASEEMQRVMRDVLTSPEVRHALVDQTTGFSQEVLGGMRGRAARMDEHADRRAVRTGAYAGIASRALAFVADAVLCAGLWVSVSGVVALIGWIVGGLRPEWLVATLATIGLGLVSSCYFVFFWSTAGRTPGMHLLHVRVAVEDSPAPPSIRRSAVRLVGLALAIIPVFAGFLPVLFDRRRRGIADMMAGTVVVYGSTLDGGVATAAASPEASSR
ncbi:MAG TPA: RDD family protein [Gaiellales bacterium]|jgi:uncharacterized RDD family membrane protein YckC|nr:RDD family protein [Gaiellales bacterium]